jgi:predicted phosphodiesterase
MKIGILSDLHMTRRDPWDYKPKDGVFYINAGDVSEDHDFRNKWNEKHEDHMFSIRGNHDYYYDTFSDAYTHMSTRQVGNIKIAGATLWTDLTKRIDWVYYVNGLIDSRYIKDLTYESMIETHNTHKKFVFESEADIIVTHHCPASGCVHPKYAGSPYNTSFSNNYDELILNMKKPPKLWICGHTHEKCDFMLDKTRIICYPRGYYGENEWYKDYEPMIVEI